MDIIISTTTALLIALGFVVVYFAVTAFMLLRNIKKDNKLTKRHRIRHGTTRQRMTQRRSKAT
jgi:hypothetical protein